MSRPEPEKVSDEIEGWLAGDGDKVLGGLIDIFLFDHRASNAVFGLLVF